MLVLLDILVSFDIIDQRSLRAASRTQQVRVAPFMFPGQIAMSILPPPFCSLLCTHKLRAPRDERYNMLLCQQHIGIVQSCIPFFTEAISDSLTKMFPCLEERSRLKKGCYFQPSTEILGVFMTGGACSLYNISHHYLRDLTTNYQSRPSAAGHSELVIPLEHSDHRSAKENTLLCS